jgi:hypothetical protein
VKGWGQFLSRTNLKQDEKGSENTDVRTCTKLGFCVTFINLCSLRSPLPFLFLDVKGWGQFLLRTNPRKDKEGKVRLRIDSHFLLCWFVLPDKVKSGQGVDLIRFETEMLVLERRRKVTLGRIVVPSFVPDEVELGKEGRE